MDKGLVSFSENHVVDKVVSNVQLTLSPVDGVDSPALVSPPNSSLCHISTSESANVVQNNASCGPNVHSQHKKILGTQIADEEENSYTFVTHRPTFMGKWSDYSEAHTALTSFEALLGSLTRTKESIGRATRMAIDCVKFGVSAKVGNCYITLVFYRLSGESIIVCLYYPRALYTQWSQILSVE